MGRFLSSLPVKKTRRDNFWQHKIKDLGFTYGTFKSNVNNVIRNLQITALNKSILFFFCCNDQFPVGNETFTVEQWNNAILMSLFQAMKHFNSFTTEVLIIQKPVINLFLCDRNLRHERVADLRQKGQTEQWWENLLIDELPHENRVKKSKDLTSANCSPAHDYGRLHFYAQLAN